MLPINSTLEELNQSEGQKVINISLTPQSATPTISINITTSSTNDSTNTTYY